MDAERVREMHRQAYERADKVAKLGAAMHERLKEHPGKWKACEEKGFRAEEHDPDQGADVALDAAEAKHRE